MHFCRCYSLQCFSSQTVLMTTPPCWTDFASKLWRTLSENLGPNVTFWCYWNLLSQKVEDWERMERSSIRSKVLTKICFSWAARWCMRWKTCPLDWLRKAIPLFRWELLHRKWMENQGHLTVPLMILGIKGCSSLSCWFCDLFWKEATHNKIHFLFMKFWGNFLPSHHKDRKSWHGLVSRDATTMAFLENLWYSHFWTQPLIRG